VLSVLQYPRLVVKRQVIFRSYIDLSLNVKYIIYMTLNEWRKNKGWSYGKLADRLGTKHATNARRWCLPQQHPDHLVPSNRGATKYMDRIIKLTNGEVMPNDFFILRE
jgi:ribosome-binding protein aMBF1 (putative translation factor)